MEIIFMSHVYRERKEVPIPDEAHINHNDGRVYLLGVDGPGKRSTIGWATSETTMHPNDEYRRRYPNLWASEYVKYNDPKGYEIHVGMYGLCLGAAYKSGLYPVLCEAYDEKYANTIMDYAMYSILSRNDVTQLYSERMRNEALFSETVYSDTVLSHFFKNELTEQTHFVFRDQWIKRCISHGLKKVWLCIDGSNNDCQMEDSCYAEYGENKSHTKKTIVGFIYAVNAETGEPITYFVNPGGVVDSKALHEIINFIVAYGLEVEGVILDRGFCTYEDVQTLNELNLDFVIMVPHGVKGHTSMLKECCETIFWDPRYIINDKDVFGISRAERQIWGIHPDVKGVLNLYFSAKNGCFKGIELIQKVCAEKTAAEKACESGEFPVIEKKYRRFFEVKPDNNGNPTVNCLYDEWKTALHCEGFFTMLSSKDYGADKVYDTYQLRIASETQYRILKSQEGFDTTRVHTDSGMLSKYAICFAASILRHSIMTACMKHNLDTNEQIQKMDRINLLVGDQGTVKFMRGISSSAQTIFSEFNMDESSFDEIARDINFRKTSPIYHLKREKPEQVIKAPLKRGRKPGSKNKSTIAREKAEAEAKSRGEWTEPPAKRAGRPFGSKDSKPRKKRSDAGIPRGKRKKV